MDVARCMLYMHALRYRTFRTIRILFHALFDHFPPAPPAPLALLSHLSFLVEAYMSPSSFLAGHADMVGQCIEIHFISLRWPIRLAMAKIRVTELQSHRPRKRRGAEQAKEMGLAATESPHTLKGINSHYSMISDCGHCRTGTSSFVRNIQLRYCQSKWIDFPPTGATQHPRNKRIKGHWGKLTT